MFASLLPLVCRALTSLRYRVRVEGLEQLRQVRGPALVLPNHPGYIDPVLVLAHIGSRLPVRPLVTTGMYRLPPLRPLMKMLQALEIPNFERHSHGAREEVGEVIRRVVEGLDRGEKFLIYPAGRIEPRGLERIGSNRAVAEILLERPQTTVVLVRTVGIWGSMASMAVTGNAPDLGRCFVRALGILAANLLFFTPRRPVTMTVEVLDPAKLPELHREKLNPFLEAWYNRGLSPEPVYVPYHFRLGPRTFAFPQLGPHADAALDKITQEVKHATFEILEKKLKRPLRDEEKAAGTKLDDLGLDSFDRMEIAQEMEDRFGFSSDQVASTLGELWLLGQGLASTQSSEPVAAPKGWDAARELPDDGLSFLAPTILEAIVRQALAHPRDVAVADDLSGVVTYEMLLVGARLMAKRFAALTGDSVGLMLPASVAADMAYAALLWAAKLPVVLNWTTGPVHLNHAAKTMQLRRVITSRKFIDRVGIKIEGVDYLFLEDLREGIGTWEKLGALLGIRLFSGSLPRRLPRLEADQTAVVLFTSGSEKMPKAVPLTHRNILSDVRAGARALGFKRGDVLLGFLPAFHSFGLSGNIVLPLAGGLRVVHHPDPTDAPGLVRKIAAYRPTLLLTTPTFYGYILGAAKPEELTSLRLVIAGAEKCPPALFAKAKDTAPHALLIEGYGVTECSPVVSVSRPDDVRIGTIGRPLDGVEIQVVDPESMEPLPPGEQGMLLVAGPTVFPGYLHYDGPSPFHEHAARRWYVTGDLARVDTDGFIHFAGRLKRFLKAGGEMISLPALEEPIAAAYPADDQGPRVAVEGVEKPEGRRIVLFTTADITMQAANALLTKAGFRGIMRLDEVRRKDVLPLLGTGKIDYKVLRADLE